MFSDCPAKSFAAKTVIMLSLRIFSSVNSKIMTHDRTYYPKNADAPVYLYITLKDIEEVQQQVHNFCSCLCPEKICIKLFCCLYV